VERRGAPDKEEYAKAPRWEKLVMDGGKRFIRGDKENIARSGYVGRFTNSLIIAVISTFLAMAMGTVTTTHEYFTIP
jgi:multiple sugar transport system permease protein